MHFILHNMHLSFLNCSSDINICTSMSILVMATKYIPLVKVRKRVRNRHNQAPHLNQDTNRKVTTSQLDITNESQEVSPFPAGDHKATCWEKTIHCSSQIKCHTFICKASIETAWSCVFISYLQGIWESICYLKSCSMYTVFIKIISRNPYWFNEAYTCP